MSYETRYHVLAWDGEGYADDPLHVARALFVRHPLACGPTWQEVIDQFEAEVGHYVAGKYRLYPDKTVIDVEVKSSVVVALPRTSPF